MPPEGTAVMNPLVEAITNNELTSSIGKTALLNPTVIEVSLSINTTTLARDFRIASWHQTNGAPASRWQVHESQFDVVPVRRGAAIMGESGTLYAVNSQQLRCGAALLMTATLGHEMRQYLNAANEQLPPFPFNAN